MSIASHIYITNEKEGDLDAYKTWRAKVRTQSLAKGRTRDARNEKRQAQVRQIRKKGEKP